MPRPLPIPVEPPIGPPGATPCAAAIPLAKARMTASPTVAPGAILRIFPISGPCAGASRHGRFKKGSLLVTFDLRAAGFSTFGAIGHRQRGGGQVGRLVADVVRLEEVHQGRDLDRKVHV